MNILDSWPERKFNSLQMQKSAGYLCTRENER